MIRRPPRSTLFPTRRSSDLRYGWNCSRACRPWPIRACAKARRLEEHTSELQSPCNLVCRLLLEKKNKHVICLANAHATDPMDVDGRHEKSLSGFRDHRPEQI